MSELDEIEDRNRKRGGFAGNRPGDQDGRAEFTKRPSKSQHAAGEDSTYCERQGDRPKDSPRPRAEGSGDLLQAWIYLLEGNARGSHQQGERHYSEGNHHGFPGKDDFHIHLLLEKLANWAAPAEKLQ